VRSLDAMAARADRVALASSGHHSGRHRRCNPHAAAARAHRCSVQPALDRPDARLDRREPGNYRCAPALTTLRLSDDVSVLGVLQFVSCRHPIRDKYSRRRGEMDSRLHLCRSAGIRCLISFRTRGSVQATGPATAQPVADHRGSRAKHLVASGTGFSRFGCHSPRRTRKPATPTVA
jgi:hypothetical protein